MQVAETYGRNYARIVSMSARRDSLDSLDNILAGDQFDLTT